MWNNSANCKILIKNDSERIGHGRILGIFLILQQNHCLILYGNNFNTLYYFLNCSELNWNKCGSELPKTQKTLRTEGLNLIGKFVILESVTFCVLVDFRRKNLLKYCQANNFLLITGIMGASKASYTCVLCKNRRFHGVSEISDTISTSTRLFARGFGTGYVEPTTRQVNLVHGCIVDIE
jgi:hypothetical protein